MKYKILIIAFLAWTVLWAVFVIRELFVKDNIRDYAVLLSRDFEGKRSYVTGDRLYEFLAFCRLNVPEGATYRLNGLEEGSIEKRRAVYYLYPRLEADKPDYLLIYNKSYIAGREGEYSLALDSARYIIKMKKGK